MSRSMEFTCLLMNLPPYPSSAGLTIAWGGRPYDKTIQILKNHLDICQSRSYPHTVNIECLWIISLSRRPDKKIRSCITPVFLPNQMSKVPCFILENAQELGEN